MRFYLKLAGYCLDVEVGLGRAPDDEADEETPISAPMIFYGDVTSTPIGFTAQPPTMLEGPPDRWAPDDD